MYFTIYTADKRDSLPKSRRFNISPWEYHVISQTSGVVLNLLRFIKITFYSSSGMQGCNSQY